MQRGRLSADALARQGQILRCSTPHREVSDEAAERGGLTIDELEDFAVRSYSLDADAKPNSP